MLSCFRFQKIDILVNNASAIVLKETTELAMKSYDLMHQINVRGTFAFSRACIPHMLQSENPHILNMSPPLSMQPHWFAPHVAYTMSKYGMSMVALGLSAELKEKVVTIFLKNQY
jgi:citronellol/citronellal dehydrogenase